MTALPTAAPKAIAYIQDGGSGELLERFPDDTEVTGYSGGGKSFESDFAGGEYEGTRQTSNPARFTGDVSARRSVSNILRNRYENHRLCNLYVLETDADGQINGFEDFKLGQIIIDVGFTNESANASIMTGNSQADPGTRDVLSFSAGTRVEIRKPTTQITANTVGQVGTLETIQDAVYVPPLNRKDPRDKGRIFAVGNSALGAPDIAVNESGGEGVWASVAATGVNIGALIETIVYLENHLIVGTDGFGAYIANLKTYGTANFYWNACAGLSLIQSARYLVAPGNNVVVLVQNATDLYVSRDGGYSFTFLTVIPSDALTKGTFIDENTILWGITTANQIRRLRRLVSVDTITVTGAGNIRSVAASGRGFEVFAGDANGDIFRCRDISVPVPVWSKLPRAKPNPSVDVGNLVFTGAGNSVMAFIETLDGSPDTRRVVVDYSAGGWVKAMIPASIDFPFFGGRLLAINQNHFVVAGTNNTGSAPIVALIKG